jgi:hypothetical protein
MSPTRGSTPRRADWSSVVTGLLLWLCFEQFYLWRSVITIGRHLSTSYATVHALVCRKNVIARVYHASSSLTRVFVTWVIVTEAVWHWTSPVLCLQIVYETFYMEYINPLKPSGNYMYHLLYQSVTLCLYWWVLYDSWCKQRLFT